MRKTKEITTVKVVWKIDLNCQKIWNLMNFCFEFLKELLVVWETISNIRKSFSSDFQTPRLHLIFSNHFSVFGN